MKQQIFAIALSLLLVLSLAPVGVLAEESDGDAGSGADVNRQRYVDADGNVRFRTVAQNEDGDKVVRTGVRNSEGDARVVTRGKSADGATGVSARTRTVDDEGNVVSRVRQARVDASGDVSVRGKRSVRDGEGNLVVRQTFARTDVAPRRAAEAISSARDRLQTARDRYQERRDRFADARSGLGNARDRLESCDDTTEDCDSARSQYRETALDFLLRTAETLGTHLEGLESFVDANIEDEERREHMFEKIGEVKGEVDAVVAELEALEDPTREELRDAANTLKRVHAKVRHWTHLAKQHIVHHKIQSAGQRLLNLEDKLYATSERLAAAGADTSELDALLEDFSYLLDVAADAHEEAREACTSAESDEVRSEDCRTLVEEAHQAFRDAVALVKEIQQEIRDLRASLTGDASAELEAEIDTGEEE